MALTFRRPDFGNAFAFLNQSVVRRTLGNELIVANNNNWPTFERLSLSISAMSQEQKNQFIDFYVAAIGEEITFTDHENVQWRGFIVTPKPEIIQYGRGCQFKTSFTFEGVRV